MSSREKLRRVRAAYQDLSKQEPSLFGHQQSRNSPEVIRRKALIRDRLRKENARIMWKVTVIGSVISAIIITLIYLFLFR